MDLIEASKLIKRAAAHQNAGRIGEAEQLLEKVARNQPANEAAVQGLLRIWVRTRRAEKCFHLLERALEAQPTNAHFHGDLAVLQQQSGQLPQAERSFREAIRLKPADPRPYLALGQLLADLRRISEAQEQFRQALRIQPALHVAWIALSVMAGMQGRLGESLHHAQRAVQTGAKVPQAHHALGSALHALGQPGRAHGSFVQCMQLGGTPSAGSSLLHNLNFIPEAPPQQVFEAHGGWAQRYTDGAPLKLIHQNNRDAERRLRIGYVSADFRAHAVSFFIEPLLEGHDRSKVEVFCYSAVSTPDAVTERLKGRADHWRDVGRLADAPAAGLVHADGIDVLVDLAGHTDRHRLGIFARRPAPVQVTCLGYPNTTGMRAIGYRLTDDHADPPGTTEQFHTEQLVRLPRTAWCYRPPESAPDVVPLPALKAGGFTFGSFNRLAKISPFTMELWSGAVLAVPGSRLMLKTVGLDETPTEKFVRESFAKFGLEGDRLILLGPDASIEAHLARYNEIDVALDCYPYHGTTTSCEAMWMGVPSIVLVGAAHVSRVGQSLATNVGLTEFLADSKDQFVEVAGRVAGNLEHLSQIRQGMRDRLRQSPLMDTAGFCRDVEGAYQKMFIDWAKGT